MSDTVVLSLEEDEQDTLADALDACEEHVETAAGDRIPERALDDYRDLQEKVPADDWWFEKHLELPESQASLLVATAGDYRNVLLAHGDVPEAADVELVIREMVDQHCALGEVLEE